MVENSLKTYIIILNKYDLKHTVDHLGNIFHLDFKTNIRFHLNVLVTLFRSGHIASDVIT